MSSDSEASTSSAPQQHVGAASPELRDNAPSSNEAANEDNFGRPTCLNVAASLIILGLKSALILADHPDDAQEENFSSSIRGDIPLQRSDDDLFELLDSNDLHMGMSLHDLFGTDFNYTTSHVDPQETLSESYTLFFS